MAATYDEVAEWWESGDWNMSSYPPSAWHAYCESVGLSIDDLKADPGIYESEVATLAEAGDGRTCECEWNQHETGCTWSPDGSKGSWSAAGYWYPDKP